VSKAVMNEIINASNAAIAATPDSKPRTEFGFTRTECACPVCVNNCRHLPGYLIPADLERISQSLGEKSLVGFAFDHLLASPGALVASRDGRVLRISTLVPRRQESGSCVFLDERSRCRIHVVSPFGCGMFDCRQSSEEADARSLRGLQEIARCWAHPARHSYTIIWRLLDTTGRRAIPPQVARQQMQQSRDAATLDSIRCE